MAQTNQVVSLLRRARSAYKLRLQRRKLQFRAFRSRRQLTALANQTDKISPDEIILAATMRNEAQRLP